MTMTEIRLVTNDDERLAVYAFRYAVIVDELGVVLPKADHERRVVIDAEDRSGHLFAAYRNGSVIGTLRVNFLRDGPVEPHDELLGLNRLSDTERQATSVSTRFLVAPAFRGTAVPIRILQTWFAFCRSRQVESDYILVGPRMQEFYVRIGFVPLATAVLHPEIGEVQPLRIRFRDEEHLRSIGSPFAKSLPVHNSVGQT